jgi:hypothetical protein
MHAREILRNRMSLVILAVVIPQAAADPPPADSTRERLARTKLEAARRTYEVVWTNNREALVPFVEVAYRWSRRWLEAELDLSGMKEDREKAYLAHRERMQKLARITRDRYQARANTVEEVTATEFYLAEAALWFEQIKNPAPPVPRPVP